MSRALLKNLLIFCGGAGNAKDFLNFTKTKINAICGANFFNYHEQSVYLLKISCIKNQFQLGDHIFMNNKNKLYCKKCVNPISAVNINFSSELICSACKSMKLLIK